MRRDPNYGLMAEFENPSDLSKAAERTYAEGYRKIDAYTPFPIEEVADAIGFHRSGVPLVVLIGGLLGGLSGYLLQYWVAAINYTINIGGRPLTSWPASIVVSLAITIMFAGLSAVFGLLAL